MVWILLVFIAVAAVAFTVRPLLGRTGTLLFVALAALLAGIAFNTQRLTFRPSEVDSRFELLSALIWTGLLLSIVLTVRALVGRSWLSMWLAALGTLPFLLLSFIGGYIFIVTCLQLASAVALRRAASARGWLLCLLGGLLYWIVLTRHPYGTSRLLPSDLWMLLLVLALLVPLVPPRLLPGVPRQSTPRTS